jgi:RNA polymerase sigma factor (sigma-70 family)
VEAFELVVTQHERLIFSDLHRRRLKPWLELWDTAYAGGLEGLWNAWRTYDAERGSTFPTWARVKIYSAVSDVLRACERVPRCIRDDAARGVLTLPEFRDIDAPGGEPGWSEDHDDEIDGREMREVARGVLPPREFDVLWNRACLGEPMRPIAQRHGVSSQRICQLATRENLAGLAARVLRAHRARRSA